MTVKEASDLTLAVMRDGCHLQVDVNDVAC